MSATTFTEEEIITALRSPNPEWLSTSSPEDLFWDKTANFQPIIDYLTGRQSILAPIHHDQYTSQWRLLLNLLPGAENITPREQLVINVIKDPVIYYYTHHTFRHWLLNYAYKNPTSNALQAVLSELRKTGLTDSDIVLNVIFSYYIELSWFSRDGQSQSKETPLESFLINQIKTWTTVPSLTQVQWGERWNSKLFSLLEENNQAVASEYLTDNILSGDSAMIQFIADYKKGNYLSYIIDFINEEDNPGKELRFLKFHTAIPLYETNRHLYTDLIVKTAKLYLDYAISGTQKLSWNNGVSLAEFQETDMRYIPYIAGAFHFILKDNVSAGIEKIDEWIDKNKSINLSVLKILHHHIKTDAFKYVEATLLGATDIYDYKATVDFIQNHFEPAQHLPEFWKLVTHKSKPLRQLVSVILAGKDPEAEQKAIALLSHKNADTRQTAAIILGYFSSDTAKNAIMNVLDSESNDAARDTLLQAIAASLPTEASMAFIEATIEAAKKRNKLNKPVEAWLNESDLPALYYTNGDQLNTEHVRFLLYRMGRVKEMRSDMEARYILQFIDRQKSNAFALALMKLFLEKDTKPEYKYLMATAALIGDDVVVDKIRTTTNRWIDENRGKMAEYGVGALALQGSDKALRWVEWYSRKYKSKKSNVGTAALVALETAADELNISIHELGDRVVPDFGFDGLFKTFNAGEESYRAFIDSNFKMAFFDDDNKKLKAVPAATDSSLKDDFKAIAKEVRDIVKSQSPRLEYYLIIQRKWRYDKWEKFFLQNPVMFIYATKLLWGFYDADGILQDTFMCNDDTSCVNVEGEEITINEASIIGIVHPTQLTIDLLQKWRQHFFDAAVDPVFPQLDRTAVSLDNIDLSKNILSSFDGKRMKEGSIRSTLEKFGWHKGPIGDGGMLTSMNLLYFEKKLEAILEVEGIGAGYGWGQEEKMGRLFVIDKTKVTNKWGIYIKDDTDQRLIPLKNVPSIFLYEMIAAILAIKPFETKAG